MMTIFSNIIKKYHLKQQNIGLILIHLRQPWNPAKTGPYFICTKLPTWFRKLTILMFLLALAVAPDLLFKFLIGPANPNSWTQDPNNNTHTLKSVFIAYVMLWSFLPGTLLTLTSTCLAIHIKKPNFSFGLVNYIQKTLWFNVILILVVGFVVFDQY